MNACPPSNHWTDHDRGCCHHPRKFPHAPTSQLPQREGNNCSDFCQQRLVLPVHLQVYSVPQQVKQGRMSTEGTSENVHCSFIVDLNLEKNPNIPSPSEWVNKLWSIHYNGRWVSREKELSPLALSRVSIGLPNTNRVPLRHYNYHIIGEQSGTNGTRLRTRGHCYLAT